MDRRQTRGLIALFAVLNIFCFFTVQPACRARLDAKPLPTMLTQGFSRAVSTGREGRIYPEAEIDVQSLFLLSKECGPHCLSSL